MEDSRGDMHTLESVIIRYEGKDADRHVIDMMALGESIQGFGRIYSVIGHFVATGQYAKQWQALEVRAFATEPKAKCFQLGIDLQTVMQSQIFSGLAGSIITAIMAFIVARSSNKSEEMRHLRELLEQQLSAQTGQNERTTERLLQTIEKLSDSLRASLKQAVTPIGQSCRHIDIIPHGRDSFSIDQATKDAILSSDDDTQLTPLRDFRIVITEMDKERGTAKVRLIEQDGDSEADSEDESTARINAKISDPAFEATDNAYLASFVSGSALSVKAKASIKDGLIRMLYVSDAS